MITMQNSWGTQGFVGESKNVVQHSSKDEFETGSMVDMSGNKNDNTDFGLMMERSISAPPPSGMGFDFEKESVSIYILSLQEQILLCSPC